jgi:uncharacterized protein (TIGR02246 family)
MTIEEVAQAYFNAVRAHDAEAVAACFDDDGELITATGHYHGPKEIATFYRDTTFRAPDLRPEPGEFLVVGNRLMVEIVLHLEGRRTAVADFFTVDGDKIRRLAVYLGGQLP